jgi:peptidoglycan/xylan/chitin deacetylase (PgdA/CDA1 family)
MLKVALSHDVDRIKKHYQYFTYPIKALLKGDVKTALYHYASCFYPEPYWNFPDIIKIEEDFGVRSTFFILDETLPFKLFNKRNWQLSLGRYKISNKKLQETVKFLDKNGWEIGVHGSYLSYQNEALLKKEKQNIENIVGHEIVGSRQHYLNWDENTWNIQRACGFKYDSTWGLNNAIGFKENKIRPFKPYQDYFTEIPLIVMDTEYIPTKNRWEKTLELMDILEENDGIFVINWHQRAFNEKELPEYRSSYIKIIEECKRRNAHFATMGEIYNDLENNWKE